ncbi:MAG: hypothetical protein M3270_09100 [Thermoproteota archaeon]|nr:hypothetical protein [Thermoproteota archaeon]
MNFYPNPDGPVRKTLKKGTQCLLGYSGYCIISKNLAKAANLSVLEGQCITIFRGAVRSTHTLDPYERRLVGFLSGIGKTRDEFVKN